VIALRSGRVAVNGTDIEALSPPGADPSPLTRLLIGCSDRHYSIELETDASATSTQQLLDEVPKTVDSIESLAFGAGARLPVRRAPRAPASGHWVRLSVAPSQIVAVELQRDASQLKQPPSVVHEVSFKGLAPAYAWLRATCAKRLVRESSWRRPPSKKTR